MNHFVKKTRLRIFEKRRKRRRVKKKCNCGIFRHIFLIYTCRKVALQLPGWLTSSLSLVDRTSACAASAARFNAKATRNKEQIRCVNFFMAVKQYQCSTWTRLHCVDSRKQTKSLDAAIGSGYSCAGRSSLSYCIHGQEIFLPFQKKEEKKGKKRRREKRHTADTS